MNQSNASHRQISQEAMDALLAAYSAGTLDPATHALVASHLLLKPENRSYVAGLEDLACERLIEAPLTPIKDRDARLAAIFTADPAPRPRVKGGVLPAPLMHFVGHDLADVHWNRMLVGVREHRISHAGPGAASLLHVKAGRRMPSHTHEGSEITLVLSGGFSDETGHYRRGDVAIAGADLDHRPITDTDEDCICFAVTDAPLHLTGPVGRIFDRLFGHR